MRERLVATLVVSCAFACPFMCFLRAFCVLFACFLLWRLLSRYEHHEHVKLSVWEGRALTGTRSEGKRSEGKRVERDDSEEEARSAVLLLRLWCTSVC